MSENVVSSGNITEAANPQGGLASQPITAFAGNPKKKRFTKKHLFIILMLAYPVLHFLIMWVFVNIDSILLTFKTSKLNMETFTEIESWGFDNYTRFFNNLRIPGGEYQTILINSLIYIPVTCFITLPLSIFASYFIFKKIKWGTGFRVIFFLPSIMPLIVLAMAFQLSLDPDIGIMGALFKFLGAEMPEWLKSASGTQSIYLFCVWAGIGYNVILIGGAMARIPKGIIEYCKLEGVGSMRELFQIVIPLSWPTITTVFILGLMSFFTVYLQPLFLRQSRLDSMTLALKIFNQAGNVSIGPLAEVATLGLMISLIGAPIIMFIRWLLNKCFAGIEF